MFKVNIKVLPKKILTGVIHFPGKVWAFRRDVSDFLVFMLLFCLFLASLVPVALLRFKYMPSSGRILILKLNQVISGIVQKFDQVSGVQMDWFQLFELAFKNMLFKKSRTIITIGGMSLGVGAIVFLVSIGYGLQNLVITRVARLDEMRQADVSIQPGSNNRLNDKFVADFEENQNVEEVLPMIGLVAKVNYQGSSSDVAVYGVTTSYLEHSAVKTVDGKLFENNSIGLFEQYDEPVESTESSGSNDGTISSRGGSVAGVSTIRGFNIGSKIQDIEYTIYPNTWLKVRKSPGLDSEVIGYTRRVEGVQFGEEYWGSAFMPYDIGGVVQNEYGEWMGRWVKSMFYVWEEESCTESDESCEDGKYVPAVNSSGMQESLLGYVAELEMVVNRVSYSPESGNSVPNNPEVLGVKTEYVTDVLGETAASESSESTSSAFLTDEEYMQQIVSSSLSQDRDQINKVTIPLSAQREAVVNSAFLKVLGLQDQDVLGQSFESSFIATSDLFDKAKKVESEPVEYKIVGVIPSDDIAYFYVPLSDLKYLGVSAYSQAKVVVENKERLQEVRQKIESLGYQTSSVADTVTQITKLFGTLRIVLALLGGVALGVASLGMFNTLTVSLLERTHEVGLMKAMGMSSVEVKRLFLTESMLMGFVGGILGILLGFIAGKLVSLVLSIFGVLNGVGFIDISYIPAVFVTLVFILSVIVGLVTGLYPSKRATRISALDALRYE